NASETKRPAVSASYGDETERTPSSAVAASETSNPQRSGNSPSVGADRSSPQSSSAEPFSDERFAATLAELPPEESAALRQMLAALREGSQGRATQVATGALPQDVPYVGSAPVASSVPSPAGSSRRTAEEFQEFSLAQVRASAPTGGDFVPAASPFVESSLSAF